MATQDEIRAKDVLPHKTSFASGDGFYGDGDSSFFMEASKLLELTAQNALVEGGFTGEFDPTRTSENPYIAYQSCCYDGKVYVFIRPHYGPWNASDVYLDSNGIDRRNEAYRAALTLEDDVEAMSKVVLMDSDYIRYESQSWDSEGSLNYGGCATYKYSANVYLKIKSESLISSLSVWNKDGSYSKYTIDSSEINLKQYPNAKYFALNFSSRLIVTNAAMAFYCRQYNVENADWWGAAKGAVQSYPWGSIEKAQYYSWDASGTLVSTPNLCASKKISLADYRFIKFTFIVHSLVLFDDNGNTLMLRGVDYVDLSEYTAYTKIAINIFDNLRTAGVICFETAAYYQSPITGNYDALSEKSYYTKVFRDVMERLDWCWARLTGDLVYADVFTSTRKMLISDYEYVHVSSPCYLVLWREDATWEVEDSQRDMISSIHGLEYKYFAFTCSSSDVSSVKLTFKKKSFIERDFPRSGYYFKPVPEDVGNISDITTLTSDAFCGRYYDGLVTKYPDYVTKQTIGKDASNTYDMYAYTFTPKSGYEYTVYMQGGVHGMLEMQGYAGLAKLMNLIADKAASADYDPLLCMLHTRVRFVIVPIVNVWEVSETAKYNLGERPTAPSSARNSNNVNLNRNWFDENPEQELVNIKTLLEGFTDIVFGFDCHTDPQGTPGWGAYLLEYANNMPAFFGERLKRVCGYLSEKNKFTDLKQSGNTALLWDAYRGDSWNYPLNEHVWADYAKGITPDYTRQHLTSTCCNGFWSMGILGGTIEHGANRFGSNCDNREMVAAVELYGNQVIEQVRCNVNLEKRIYDLENPS